MCKKSVMELKSGWTKIAAASEVAGITSNEEAHEDIKVCDTSACIVVKSK